jgi:MTH538 TIR-like domain (DUF1863)
MSNNNDIVNVFLRSLDRNQAALKAQTLRRMLEDALNRTTPLQTQTSTKRKAFFSFHYDDIMRVNNVRNAFKIYNPPNTLITPTFYDSSLWESRKLDGDDSLKRLIREGVYHTSLVCVLVGTETWSRPWVRYEIARSVIDEKGLLAIDINHINHHQTQSPHELGPNPLSYMAVGRMVDGSFRLFEKKWAGLGLEVKWNWTLYEKHTQPVSLPKYLAAPEVGYVKPLDKSVSRYNFIADNGQRNIGQWLDFAAKQVGR